MNGRLLLQEWIAPKTIVPVIVLSLLALFAAFAVQMGTKVVLVMASAILAPLILFMPLVSLVYLILAVAFVIGGSLMYFAKLNAANWIPYLLCMLLAFRLIADRLTPNAGTTTARTGLPVFLLALLGFFLCVVVSSVINEISFGFWVLAFKNYISVWLLAFLLWKSREFAPSWPSIWNGFLWVAVLQVPVAIYQRFKSATGQLHSRLNWDAIVGTFGGDPDASGLSGAMALFMVFSALLAGSLWRREKLSTQMFLLVLLSSVLVIGLAEVKAAIVLFPLAAFYLFRDMPARRPKQFIAGVVLVVLLMLSLLYAYYLMYVFRDGIDRGFVDTLASKFTGVFFDAHFIDRFTGEVGRLPALLLWWSGNSSDALSALLGHGPMAVRISSLFGPGDVLRQYTINIGMYSLPVFLWEIGLLAVGIFLMSLYLAMRAAAKLSANPGVPEEHKAVLDASAFGIFMIALFLPYNRDMIDSAAIQSLLALIYAYVAYWWRIVPATRPIRTAMFGSSMSAPPTLHCQSSTKFT